MKKLPTKNNSTLILCEDVRQEVGNKASFMGVFFDKIIFNKDADKFITPFSVSYIARDGEGEFHIKLQFVNPANEITINDDLGLRVKHKENPLLMTFKFPNLVFQQLGIYTMRILLDDEIYETQINVDKEK